MHMPALKTIAKKPKCLKILSVFCICLLLMFLYQNNKTPKLVYPTEYQNILEHMETEDIKQYKKDKERLKSLIQQTQKDIAHCHQVKKKLSTLEDQSKEAERAMYDAMDKALYVGKFICKVNTCQGNPDDPNYNAFLNATNHLVAMKKQLADAKTALAKAKEEAEQLTHYKQLLRHMEKTLTQLQKKTR
ncbi:hypothetical protein DXC47_01230 [Eubacterium sp. TF05-29]|nr:hypothetical protein DW969_07280 [Eubacterium sp. AM47-9]RJV84676.1 hypothetical protein DWX13_10770 [Eubacterium sp. AF18-3]RJW10853.1 hypothetical protein DW751_03315 [Eubacterium sp. AM28-8LB]RJW29447.1 hypothetical protein DXC47_01230 [Eubacterium sp. TF05-29]